MKNSSYWKLRFTQLEEAMNSYGTEAYYKIEPGFTKAQMTIQKEIDSWIARVAKNNQLTMTDARKLLSAGELAEFKWDIKEFIKYGENNNLNKTWMQQLENASAKYHISRLEALNLRTQQAMEIAFGNELDNVDMMTRKVYTEGYYHTCYEIQKGLNIGWNIGQIDQNRLNKIISNPWLDEDNFSSRIWKRKNQMTNALQTELERACLLGKSPDEAIKNMRTHVDSTFKNAKYAAGRLVMTEQSYFASESQKEAYSDLNVSKVEVIATLDSHTSPICQQMDGKVILMRDYRPGYTAPPFHPYCRTVTAPYFDDPFATGERAARNEKGEIYYVPDTMKYNEWKHTLVDGNTEKLKVLQKDKISGIIKKNYNSEIATKLGSDFYDALHDRINACESNSLAKVWEKYEDKILVGNPNYKGNAYCSGKAIYVSKSQEIKGSSWEKPYSVTFHESGHAIDGITNLGVNSKGITSHFSSSYKDGIFPKTIIDEVDDYVKTLDKKLKLEFNSHKTDFEWMHTHGYISDWKYDFYKTNGAWIGGETKYTKSIAYSAFEKEIRSLEPFQKADLSDILEGATGGKISCGFGHGKTYWTRRTYGGINDGLATEAFAEFTSSLMTTPESTEILKKYLPKSFEVYLEMIEELLK